MQAILKPHAEVATVDLGPASIRFLVTAEDTDGEWSLLDYLAKGPFAGPAPHVHREATETFMVTEGVMKISADGIEHELRAGDTIIVPPGTVHRFWNEREEPLRFMCHLTHLDLLPYFKALKDLIAGAPTWPLDDMSLVVALAERFDTYSF